MEVCFQRLFIRFYYLLAIMVHRFNEISPHVKPSLWYHISINSWRFIIFEKLECVIFFFGSFIWWHWLYFFSLCFQLSNQWVGWNNFVSFIDGWKFTSSYNLSFWLIWLNLLNVTSFFQRIYIDLHTFFKRNVF